MDGRNCKVTLVVVVALTIGGSLTSTNLEQIHAGSGLNGIAYVFLKVTLL